MHLSRYWLYGVIQKNLNKAPQPLFRSSKTSVKSVQRKKKKNRFGVFTANFEQTSNVVHASICRSCFMLQQLLRGEIFKNFGKGGEPYLGGLSIVGGIW